MKRVPRIMVMAVLLGVENKKGAVGALVVGTGRGSYSPRCPAMDVTNHGASDDDRDDDEIGSGRYGVPCQPYWHIKFDL
jgi:hypothetical protein